MSLLSRDQLRIFIGPQQVDFVRTAGLVTRKLVEQRVLTLPAPAPGEAPWGAALSTLKELLAELRQTRANAEIVLSNHFVRYVLVRHSAETKNGDEEQALIRHYFTSVYGPSAERWEYRLSDGGNEELQVAAAVAPELVDSLTALFGESKLKLRSIQPHLMAAFNVFRRTIREDSWFALVEPGVLCLARFTQGQWRSLRTISSHGEWPHELATHLLRAQFLNRAATMSATIPPVYVYAPGAADLHWTQLEHQFDELFGDMPLRLLRLEQSSPKGSSGQPLFAQALTG